MILLKKGGEPAILANNRAVWTQVLIDRQVREEAATKTEKGRYSHTDIKAAILTETHGKCAYCESKIRHVSPGDIEHIVPKSSNLAMWFAWENLTLACDNCNTNKGTTEDLVDPYIPDPEDAYIFMGTAMLPMPGNDRAFVTERTLKLNRADLVDRRSERLEYLWTLLDLIASTAHAGKKAALVADFKNELSDDREYAALSRAVAREAGRRGLI